MRTSRSGSSASASETVDHGTAVTLSATPATGSTFTGWSGACTGTGACTVTMSGATVVTATFGTADYPLIVNIAGNGSGSVTSFPAGISCCTDCSESYSPGTLVNLTAAPSVGSTFAGWSGGGCSGTGSCTVTMNAATTVTATFAVPTYVKASNTGGGDGFGYRVALSADGSTLAVVAFFEDSASTGINGDQTSNAAGASGAVYVFYW